MFTGIKFNGKHSYKDFGLTLKSREIGYPSKIKRKERVPFSNNAYDFSGIYGGQEYEERQLTYVFNVIDKRYTGGYKFNFSNTQMLETELINWLMNTNKKGKLVDDTLPGYYFLAEIEGDPSSSFEFMGSELTIAFTAYPFKISELYEGHDIWDEFNFLLDYAQITDFEISGQENITLYNAGATIVKPAIKTTAPFTIIKNGRTYNVAAGTSDSYDFMLNKGETRMTLKGTGSISFLFRKELI